MACLVCFCLTGCGKQAPTSDTVRQKYENLSNFLAHIKIISDLNDSTLEYEADYEYNKDSSDHLTLTAPESVQGISLDLNREADGAITLYWQDAVLDDGMTARSGATAADGASGLLSALATAVADETWQETANGVTLTVVRYTEQTTEQPLAREIWLDGESLLPVCADVYLEDRRVLQLSFSDCAAEEAGDPK